MNRTKIVPTGLETRFSEHELIVSKTDTRGVITYANDIFRKVSGYSEEELLGKPHNILRHPDMPRCVFKYLWEELKKGKEMFGYVINLAKNGNHYWVFAHMTPSYDNAGQLTGYHSSRRVAYRDALEPVVQLYATLRGIEERAPSPDVGMEAGYQALLKTLAEKNTDYDQFVFSLSEHTSLAASVK